MGRVQDNTDSNRDPDQLNDVFSVRKNRPISEALLPPEDVSRLHAWQTVQRGFDMRSGAFTVRDVSSNQLSIGVMSDGTLGLTITDKDGVFIGLDGRWFKDNSVTDTQLDYPRFWQEIARTTLTVAGDTITVSNIPARKYLMFLIYVNAASGTTNTLVKFNNDGGANYAYLHVASYTDAAPTTAVSQTSFPLESGQTDDGGIMSGRLEVIANIATEEKNYTWKAVSQDAAGAATVPTLLEGFGKWANTTDQINRIDITNDGTGNFSLGSEVVVLGHD